MGWNGGRLSTIYWSVQLYITRLWAVEVDEMGTGCRCRLCKGSWRLNELMGALVKVEFREGRGAVNVGCGSSRQTVREGQ